MLLNAAVVSVRVKVAVEVEAKATDFDEDLYLDASSQEQNQVSNLQRLAMFELHLDEQTIDYLDSQQQSVRVRLFVRKFHLLLWRYNYVGNVLAQAFENFVHLMLTMNYPFFSSKSIDLVMY